MNVWITSLQPSQMILLLGWKLLLQESILFCLFIGQWPDSADKRMTGTKLCAGQLQSIRKWRRNPYFSQPSHFFSPLASGSKLGSTCRQSSFLSSSSSVDWIFGITVHFLPIFLYSLTLHPAWSSQCLIEFLRGGRDPLCVSMRPGSSDQNKSRTNLRPALTPLLPALGCKNSFHCCWIDFCNCLSSDNLKHFNFPLLLALRCRNSYQCRCNPFELTFAFAFLRKTWNTKKQSFIDLSLNSPLLLANWCEFVK